ncbi:glycosyltransferase [Sphingobacterium sp.]|uniref:glycosyltransferase family 4 protein n=1 Tax=Sphingobacterium sp. TaxID=341027 RepID=UPI0028A20212|nr:glycosyltransferase [Sphingobacterium sp.]
MARIALVTIRYGKEVNGGAEYHCRMLAERLVQKHEVTVLTTNKNSSNDESSNFNTGTSILNGVNVIRFPTQDYDLNSFKNAARESKSARKIRRMIYRMGLSSLLFKMFPIWRFKLKEEIALLKQHEFYAPELLSFIESNKANYDVFIFFTYENPLTVLGSLIVPEKTILVPTAHMEGMLFRSINSIVFNKVKYIAFNSEAEFHMCQEIFQDKMAPNSVVGVGIEIADAAPKEITLSKYQIQQPYFLYCGRITAVKINNFIQDFLQYREENQLDICLVLAGEVLMPMIESPYIKYIGYVDEAEKIALMQSSIAVVNPSAAESLSLVTLEALSLGKIVIASKQSEVMVEHQNRSNGAVRCYGNYHELKHILDEVIEITSQPNDIAKKGMDYVDRNYNWDLIIRKFERIFKSIITV